MLSFDGKHVTTAYFPPHIIIEASDSLKTVIFQITVNFQIVVAIWCHFSLTNGRYSN